MQRKEAAVDAPPRSVAILAACLRDARRGVRLDGPLDLGRNSAPGLEAPSGFKCDGALILSIAEAPYVPLRTFTFARTNRMHVALPLLRPARILLPLPLCRATVALVYAQRPPALPRALRRTNGLRNRLHTSSTTAAHPGDASPMAILILPRGQGEAVTKRSWGGGRGAQQMRSAGGA